MYNFIILLISLLLIVMAATIFCNALEHLGEKLGISDGVTGSIFAAVGTALPETVIPLLAIFGSHQQVVNMDIGVGTILGAPLMLSTLSVFVMAIFVVPTRGIHGKILPESTGIRRDLRFFLGAYCLAFIAATIPHNPLSWFINVTIAISLFVVYFIYLLLTIKSSKFQVDLGHNTVATSKLYIEFLGLRLSFWAIIAQLVFALFALVYFADMFIDSVRNVASSYRLSPFLLALVLVPIATELPEKINSIVWLRKGKDTLALSNITGAMVFQGTLLPAIGILFSNWGLSSRSPLITIAITMLSTLWIYKNARKNNLKVWHFMVNGLLYVVNLWFCIIYH